MTPRVTVVIPAYNAADTLGEALDSLIAQDLDCWSAIVVDDGSKDMTAAVAQAYVAKDHRFRLLSQANAGASAARNAGIAAADGEWMLFLDADDWISPDFFSRMLAAAGGRPKAGAVYCGYNRVRPDGGRLPQDWDENVAEDPFRSFSRGCPVVMHGVIVKRALVTSVGGFDTELVTCEDWDLWQKIARTGARFEAVADTLAFYRLREGSLSTKTVQMLRDGLIVTARAWRADPRVLNPALEHAQGRPNDKSDGSAGYFLCWCAGEYAVQGHDCEPLFDGIGPLPKIRDRADQLVDATIEGMLVGSAAHPQQLAALWPELEPRLSGFLKRLERALRRPGLARRMRYGLKVQMLNELLSTRPTTQAQVVDVRRMGPIQPGPGIDTLHLTFQVGGQQLGETHVPVWGTLSRQDVVRAALESMGYRKLLRHGGLAAQPGFWLSAGLEGARSAKRIARVARRTTPNRKQSLKAAAAHVLGAALRRDAPGPAGDPDLSLARVQAVIQALDAEARASVPAVAAASRKARLTRQDADPTRDPKAFFEQVFEDEDPWNYTNSYESLKYDQTLALLPDRPIGKAMEVACAEGHFTRMLAPKVERLLAVDIAAKAIERAAERCADLTNIDYRQFDLIKDAFPKDLDLIVCSEVLYYLEDETRLKVVARRMSEALAPGGMLLMAHAFQLSDDDTRTGFDWGDSYGGQTISDVFEATPGLRLERALVTDLYRINLFSRPAPGAAPITPLIEQGPIADPLPPEVERYVVWGGAAAKRADLAEKRTNSVPVLCYHRIADDGPEDLADYRVTPQAFEAQMRLLRRHGYHAITSADLIGHMASARPFHGRPVLITFDDGYQDFHDAAWPILQRYDFTAEVFIVTGKVGTASDWDVGYGAPAPLMDWPTIQALHAQGAVFGSHLVTHTSAEALSPGEILREAVASRAVLEARLGSKVESVAAPYGIYDSRLKYILDLSGYKAAFTTEDARASIFHNPMSLPRVDVAGDLDLESFAEAIGLDLSDEEAARLEHPA